MKRHRLKRRYGHARLRHPTRAEMIAALGLEAEGRKRHDKYNFSTAEFWHEIRHTHSKAARSARRMLGVPEPKG